jgi:HEAT repeat protein
MKSLTTWWKLRQAQATDPLERARAIRKLANQADSDSRAAMMDALADAEPFVRAAASTALGENGRRDAIAPLTAMLFEEREHIVIEAIMEALNAIDTEMAIRQLLPGLDNADPITRQNTATALRTIGWENLSVGEKVRVSVVQGQWEEVIALGSAAVEPLVRAFRGGSQHVMRETGEALGMIEAPEAAAALVKLLVDPKLPRIGREIASWSLRKFKCSALPGDVAAWMAVTDGDWGAAENCGELAVDPLKYALYDDRREFAREAALTIRKIGGTRAVLALAAALADAQQDVSVREVAAISLGDLKFEESIPPLVTALSDESWTVREQAASSLRRLNWAPENDVESVRCALALQEWERVATQGEDAIPALVDALRYQSIGADAAKALMQIGDAGVTALLDALKSAEQPMSVREVIAHTLVEVGDKRAIEPIISMLDDPDVVVRQMAVWTLERFGWTPMSDRELALVAVAHEKWDELPALGPPAVDALLSLARQELAPRETVDALGDVAAASIHRLSNEQLRKLAELPDLRMRNSNIFVTREAMKLNDKPGIGITDMAGRKQMLMPAQPQERDTTVSAESFVSCAAVRQIAKVELSRRGVAS